MRKVRCEFFKYDVNWPYISPSTYICTTYTPTKQDRRKVIKDLYTAGFKATLKAVTHNDKTITLSYMLFKHTTRGKVASNQ